MELRKTHLAPLFVESREEEISSLWTLFSSATILSSQMMEEFCFKLRNPAPRAKAAFECFNRLRVTENLGQFSPRLVSTICLDIDTQSSDLDIICQFEDASVFAAEMIRTYSSRSGFEISKLNPQDQSIFARFHAHGFIIEIFGQPIPVEQQNAYRHFMVMQRLLSHDRRNSLRQAVRHLKQRGLKSEPAFAHCLKLSGDPFKAMLDLYDASDGELAKLVERFEERGASL
ncbi:MAG: DUF4269 domain-containing protein [Acidobacteriota bacterium]